MTAGGTCRSSYRDAVVLRKAKGSRESRVEYLQTTAAAATQAATAVLEQCAVRGGPLPGATSIILAKDDQI